jgi:[ribosomal protein S18]-alanine N-acetyltransferase
MLEPIERATPDDLERMIALEHICFQPWRRASRMSLERSLESEAQSVWVVRDGDRLAAMLVLWHHPKALRIYDIATHPDHRGKGLASRLVDHTELLARQAGANRVILEADPKEGGLVQWYLKRGFAVTLEKLDFYAPGRSALRMEKTIA